MKSILEELRKVIKEEGGVSAGGTSAGGTSAGGTSASLGASPTPAMGQATVNGKPWTSGKSYPAKKRKKQVKEEISNVKILTKDVNDDNELLNLEFEVVYNNEIYYIECYAIDLNNSDDYAIHVYKTEAQELSDETEVAKGYIDSTGGSYTGDELAFYDYDNDYSELIDKIEQVIMDNMVEVSLPESVSAKNEALDDPIFSVSMGNDFINGADVYKFSNDLYEVLFTAKDGDELIPVYVAGGIMYDDGEWNTYPLPTSAIYEMQDAEKRREILDKWRQFRTESLVFDNLVQEIADKIQQLPKEQYEAYGDWAGKGIYNPSTIMKAYKLEQSWLNSLELGEDEQAPQIMLFVSDDGKNIKNTKLVDRSDIETYKPADNEYFLDMTRDSGDIITDFNLEPVSKLMYQWGLSESKSDVVTRLKKVLEDVDTNKLFPLDDGIAEIENKLMRIRAQIKKDPENTELVQKRDKLEEQLQSAKKRRDKLMNESKLNEISDELASKAVAKRVQLKKQDSDALDKQAANIVNLQNREFPRVSDELKQAQDEYGANLDDYTNNPKSNRNKANRLFRTVAKRAQRLNRKDEYGSYFNRLKRKGDKLMGESMLNEISDELADKVNNIRHRQASEKGELAKKAFVAGKGNSSWEQQARELWDAGKKAKRNDDLYKKRRFRKEFPDGTMSKEDADAYKDRDELEKSFGVPLKDYKLGKMAESVITRLHRILEDEEYKVEIWTAIDPESEDGFTSESVNSRTFTTPEEANEWAKTQVKQGAEKHYYTVTQGDKIIADSRKKQNEAMDMTVDYDAVENALTKHLNKLGFKPVEGENAFVYENDEGNYTHQIAYYKQPAEILYTIYNDEDGKIFENSAEAKNETEVDRFFKETVYPEFDGHESYNKPVSKMINEEYGPYQDDPRFEEISDQLESGFTSGYGYDYEWGPITINGSPIREALKTVEVRDYVCHEISYPVKDGFDNYIGLNLIFGDYTGIDLKQKDILTDLAVLGFDSDDLNALSTGNKDEIETWIDYDLNFQEDEIEEDDKDNDEEDAD